MNKKIIAIIAAVVLVLVVALVATLVACNNGEQNGNESGSQVELPSESEGGSGNGGSTTIGDPGEYEYTACNETVYVSSSAATLRTAEYEAKGDDCDLKIDIRLGLDGMRYTFRMYNYSVTRSFVTSNGDGIFYIDRGRTEKFMSDAIKAAAGDLNIEPDTAE